MFKDAFILGYTQGLKKAAEDDGESQWDPRATTALLGGGLGALIGSLAKDPKKTPIEEDFKIVEVEDKFGKKRQKLVPRAWYEKVPGWLTGAGLGAELGAGWGHLVHTDAQRGL